MQGGVGDCTHETARALFALGVEVGVLTSTRAVANSATGVSWLTTFPMIAQWNWSALQLIRQTIHNFDADIVHVEYQTAAFRMHPAINFLPRFLALWDNSRRNTTELGRAGVRVCVTFHDLRVPYLFPKAGPVRDWVTQELAHSSDAVIATNDDDLATLWAWKLKHAILIPIGSNISATPPGDFNRSAWRAQLGIGDNETLLCYFGFLNESKGGETLIRALALVANAKLLMIGGQIGASDPSNAAYLAKIKALIAELGLTQRVLWTDYTPQEIVTANFLASDLCVMPYREGASFRHGTLMAALAHGMPIITTASQYARAPGFAHLRDKENCLLVPPSNSGALADAIHRAVASPELCMRIGAGARELAQQFSWDKIAHQYLEQYQRILQ